MRGLVRIANVSVLPSGSLPVSVMLFARADRRADDLRVRGRRVVDRRHRERHGRERRRQAALRDAEREAVWRRCSSTPACTSRPRPTTVTVPCSGWLPIENVNAAGAAPVPVSVIGVARVLDDRDALRVRRRRDVQRDRSADPICGGAAASVALAVNVNAPDCVGVPGQHARRAQRDAGRQRAARDRPAVRREAAGRRHRVALYGLVDRARRRASAAATVTGSKTRIVSVAVAVIAFASVSSTPKVNAPEAVGVPDDRAGRASASGPAAARR